MKKYLITAFILLVSSGTCLGIYQSSTHGNRSGIAGGGGCTSDTDITTSFTEANLDDWTQNVGTWTLDTTNDELDSPSDYGAIIYHDTQITTIQGWAKVQFPDEQYYPKIMFRIPGTTGNAYALKMHHNGAWSWEAVATASGSVLSTIDTTSTMTMAADDYVAIAWEGTEDGATLRVWKNPTGDTPCDWGTADDTLSSSGMNASHYADTGLYVGLSTHGFVYTADNFTAGDWSE